jgi:hypothetical protein
MPTDRLLTLLRSFPKAGLFLAHLLNEFGDEEGDDEQADREKDFE